MQKQAESFPDLPLPLVFTTLVHMIRSNDGLRSEGIFRLSGSLAEVQRLKGTLDKGAFDVQFRGDCNTPACALKQWIAELSEPLVPRAQYEAFVGPVRGGNPAAAVKAIDSLPEHNRRVMWALLKLLQEVLKFASENRMTATGLAIVFSPGVFGSDMTDPMAFMVHGQVEAQCVEALITHASF